ncbi:MAG: hypothetical protein ACYDA8_07305 [Deferrisomatales bacterium]
MTWPFRPSPPAVAGAAPAWAGTHHSPALGCLAAELPPGGGLRVLDLGPTVGANVAFLSRCAGRLQIADLVDSLAADPDLAVRAEREPGAVFGRLLPPGGDPYDLVLAWDALDSLGRGALASLAAHLARLCRAEARLLAFFWTGPERPDHPLRYRIEGPDTLAYEPAGSRDAGGGPGQGYAPAEVERLLRPWASERTFLLRHGLREHLMVLRG